MKIKTPKQFEAAVKEMLEQLRIFKDQTQPDVIRERAKKRGEELDLAITACPFTYDQNQSVVVSYRIHITPSYCFRFQSILPWWKRALLRLVGWRIETAS